ncbi:hypothetical protein TRFO_04312 [Tritrichomonas foetus]|uniref:Uncharacterized protein n=1 Tax=Tritrichomonas foetus TaxID=1144522 RepID=A0A1J4KFT7_9EUKA|nr:hypothetical protein TRFO_04312 [Tritrichomonas foetus]|eukprot:OHT10279.1 hypothetical protein TRFO_04312 [Tritrichomonas foetus]
MAQSHSSHHPTKQKSARFHITRQTSHAFNLTQHKLTFFFQFHQITKSPSGTLQIQKTANVVQQAHQTELFKVRSPVLHGITNHRFHHSSLYAIQAAFALFGIFVQTARLTISPIQHSNPNYPISHSLQSIRHFSLRPQVIHAIASFLFGTFVIRHSQPTNYMAIHQASSN